MNFEAFSGSQKGIDLLSSTKASNSKKIFSKEPSLELAKSKNSPSYLSKNRGLDLNSSFEFVDIEAQEHIAIELAVTII